MRTILAALVALCLVACASPAEAQTQVQGVVPITSTLTGTRPLAIGGKTPTGTSAFVNVDANGNLILNGIAPTSSSSAVSVTTGINPTVDTVTPQGELTSSGTSEVVIAAAVSGQRNYLVFCTAENTSTVNINTVRIKDRVTGKILTRATLSPGSSSSAGGQAFWDTNNGVIQSSVGSALVFVLSAANGTDVIVTASTVTK